jgi:hypothetical protein
MPSSPALAVRPATSYARGDGDDVLLSVEVGGPVAGEDLRVRLRRRKGRARVEVAATSAPTGNGALVTARIPRDRLRPGVWQVLVVAGDDVRRARARLVLAPRRPIALVTGRMPSTTIEPPTRRPRPAAAQEAESAKPRVEQSARAVAEKALGLLPPERADRYRGKLGDARRRLAARLSR